MDSYIEGPLYKTNFVARIPMRIYNNNNNNMRIYLYVWSGDASRV